MSDIGDRRVNAPQDPDEAPDAGRGGRARARLTATMASAKSASERHVALAVPLRAAERNRRVAASVLAGGLAYRLFLWLLPFGLIVGGALGLPECGQHREGGREGWPSGGDQRRDRRRLTCRTLRLVVAPRGRRGGPPLGGLYGREGGEARPFARLGRAPVEDEAAPGITRLHRGAVARSGPRSRSHGGSVARRGRASCSAFSASRRSRGCGSWCRFTFRTGTPPGRRCCPARSSSRSDSRCSTKWSSSTSCPSSRSQRRCTAASAPRRRSSSSSTSSPRSSSPRPF